MDYFDYAFTVYSDQGHGHRREVLEFRQSTKPSIMEGTVARLRRGWPVVQGFTVEVHILTVDRVEVTPP